MDSDQGKLFIGGISWETTEDKLKDYFGQFGDVIQAVIMRDKLTGRPRGFGFVVFSDPASVDSVLQDKHTIDGRTVEAKRALSREEQQHSNARSGSNGGSRSAGSGGNLRTKKIFVGGLPATLAEDGFRQYFENYGHVTDAVIMYDQNTQRPRGFGFISFDSEDAVDRVLHKTFHDLSGKQVEVKRAFPKDANPGMNSSGGGGGGSAGGGGYQGYNSSGGSANSYDGRMDSSRYMQNQNPGGAAFAAYGSSGYGTPGYGYGPANSGMGYGGYTGYGGANAGYGGPGATYGNPNVASAGYANGPAARSLWNSQNPGYGAVGYGNAGPWGAAAAGSGGPAGQSATGASGYANQGYGYAAGYGSSDGSYAGQAGYGNASSRSSSNPGGNTPGGGATSVDGHSSGYVGRAYGDANAHSGAYGAGAWRSDTAQVGNGYGAQPNGSHAAYGSGYGGAEARHAQQQ